MKQQKLKKVNAMGKDIFISPINEEDYFSLNDMVKDNSQDRFIKSWLTTKKTIEFLAAWERLHNPNFKWVESNPFKPDKNGNISVSVSQWIEETNAIGIRSKKGKGGGTVAHVDIAFHFAMWLSPEFHLAIVKDYQRLKREELERGPWNAKRTLAKVNYKLHTDAIRDFIIPLSGKPEFLEYTTEADLINIVIFGKTAAKWEKENPVLAARGENQRDHADLCQLSVLANMEAFNSMMISRDYPLEQRKIELFRESKRQLQSMYKAEIEKRSYLN